MSVGGVLVEVMPTVLAVLLLTVCWGALTDVVRGPLGAATAGLPTFQALVAAAMMAFGFVVGLWWVSILAGLSAVAATVGVARTTAPGGSAESVGSDERLRVVTANLFYRNERAHECWAAIEAFNPDVVLLQEVSPLSGRWLPPPGWHVEIDPRNDAFGTAALTRGAPTDCRWIDIGGLPQLRLTVEVAGTEVTAWSLHPCAGVTRRTDRLWRCQLEELAPLLRSEDGVVIAAGDFNATAAHGPFRRLLHRAELSDARPSRRRLLGTWPSGGAGSPRFVPHRLMTLDHVLVRGARVVSVQILRSTTSDHHPVAVELAIPVSS